jgi:dUTP pyrophosphatase
MEKILVVNKSDNELPKYETLGAAGMDLRAWLPNGTVPHRFKGENFEICIDEDGERCVVINPGGRILVPTGLHVAIPEGHEIQIRPRSGLALKNGITCLNTPGTIDEDYRGDVGVILINHGTTKFEVRSGDRIAQMVLTTYAKGEFEIVDELPSTDRGEGGFNSTGTK